MYMYYIYIILLIEVLSRPHGTILSTITYDTTRQKIARWSEQIVSYVIPTFAVTHRTISCDFSTIIVHNLWRENLKFQHSQHGFVMICRRTNIVEISPLLPHLDQEILRFSTPRERHIGTGSRFCARTASTMLYDWSKIVHDSLGYDVVSSRNLEHVQNYTIPPDTILLLGNRDVSCRKHPHTVRWRKISCRILGNRATS